MEEVSAAEAANVNPDLAPLASSTAKDEKKPAPAPAAPPSKKTVFCQVIEPVKHKASGLAVQGYVTFTVVTQRPDGKEVRVSRRYRSFDWLRQRLRTEFPDVLVPPLPEKTVLDRFGEDFLEYRRKELERFLKRILEHPALGESPSVLTFISGSEEEIEAEQAAGDAKEEKKSLWGSITSLNFSEVTAKLSGAVTAASTVPVEVMPWFDAQTGYIRSLGEQLLALQTRSNVQSSKLREMVDSLKDFSHASALLASCESQQDEKLAEILNRLSDILSQMSTLSHEVVVTQTDVFEYAVKDYIRIVAAAREILDTRQASMHKWQIAAYDLKGFQEKAESVKNDAPKFAAASVEVDMAKKVEEELKKEFKRVSKKVKRELEEFRVQKGAELRAAIRNLVKANMDYELRMADLWKELLREMTDAENPLPPQ